MSHCTNPPATGHGATDPVAVFGGPTKRAARVAELTAGRFSGCPSRRPGDRIEQAAVRWLTQSARRARMAAELARTGGQVSFSRGRHTIRAGLPGVRR